MTMPNHADLERSLGRVEGNQSAMEARMDRFEKLVTDGFDKVEKSLEAMRGDMHSLKTKESERKGAWKVLASISAVISAVVAALIEHFAH